MERLLKVDEVIESGDLTYAINIKEWLEYSGRFGTKVLISDPPIKRIITDLKVWYFMAVQTFCDSDGCSTTKSITNVFLKGKYHIEEIKDMMKTVLSNQFRESKALVVIAFNKVGQ